MQDLNRRKFMQIVTAGLAARICCSRFVYGKIAEKEGQKIPVLHATDLFRPHMDPDDHWDLACIYALAYRGDIDLKGILIDHPPLNRKDRNPDTMAVAQMNLICGIYAPVAVGSGLPLKSRKDTQPNASYTDHHGGAGAGRTFQPGPHESGLYAACPPGRQPGCGYGLCIPHRENGQGQHI